MSLTNQDRSDVHKTFNQFAIDPSLRDDTRLTDIWGVELNKKDAADLAKFVSVFEEVRLGKSTRKISRELSIPYTTVRRWRSGVAPNIIKTLKSVINLEKPKPGWKWLSLTLGTHGGLKGPIIQVVEKIRDIQELRGILGQLEPLETTYERAFQFGLSKDDIIKMKTRLFFYLLGIVVGDAFVGRRRHRKTPTRDIDLTLSKKHKSNLRFGEFVAMCVNSLGLKVNRLKDRPKTKYIPNGAYRWRSQSSLLVKWIFETCLGLHEDQKTTYDSIKADWILTASNDEKVSFIQGLADSDGFNDIQSLEVHIISLSNASLIQAILKSLGVKCRRECSTRFGTENVIMRMKDAHALPVYNPWVASYRFTELNGLMKAKRYTNMTRWPDWLRDEITHLIKAKKEVREIFDTLLDRHGVLIPCATIRYFAKTLEEDYQMRNVRMPFAVCRRFSA